MRSLFANSKMQLEHFEVLLNEIVASFVNFISGGPPGGDESETNNQFHWISNFDDLLGDFLNRNEFKVEL